MTDLYAFTSHKFTNADAIGSYGPTLQQVRNKYNVTWANTYINMSNNNGIQLWTVPVTGSYKIRAVGASGSNEGETAVQVGKPADMTGTFLLNKDDVIKILVGQTGWSGSTTRPGWGGGGGTFVASSNDTPLIVAGGCGSGHTTKILRGNDEGAQMTGYAVNNNTPLTITYISETTNGVKVYIVKDSTLTKVVSTDSGVRVYYEGEPANYDPTKLNSYTVQLDASAYIMRNTKNYNPPVTYRATSDSGTRQNANTGTSGMLETGTAGTWTNPLVGGGDGAGFDNDGSIGNGIIYDNLPTNDLLNMTKSTKPTSFKNGGIGGSRGGGFGGGGSTTNTWGGGGGGYNGGQGGKTNTTFYNGGGGGSYNSGTNQTNQLYTNAATTMSHGFVEITIIEKTATLTASQTTFYQKFVYDDPISFDVISSNAGSVSRTHQVNIPNIVSIPSSTVPFARIREPGKTTIKVTQPAINGYGEVINEALITIVIIGSGKTYTSENMTGVNLTNINLTGSVFSSCNLTSADLSGTTINATTNFSTANLQSVKSGRMVGTTSLLPADFKMI